MVGYAPGVEAVLTSRQLEALLKIMICWHLRCYRYVRCGEEDCGVNWLQTSVTVGLNFLGQREFL